MRCKHCNNKFVSTRFLQKFCENPDCKTAEKEWQKDKVSGTVKKIPKCKGTSIAAGNGCGTPQEERIHGLGVKCKCYSKWLLGTPEGTAKLKRITLSVTSPRIELAQAFDDKKNRTKLNGILLHVRQVCHEYIRFRDKGKPCISCGDQWKDDHQCGHFYKSELYSNLRFEEKNLNSQCKICNLRKEGNESGYRAGIMQRFGTEHLNHLDEKAKAYKRNDYHWDRVELEEIRKHYQFKLKELQQ